MYLSRQDVVARRIDLVIRSRVRIYRETLRA